MLRISSAMVGVDAITQNLLTVNGIHAVTADKVTGKVTITGIGLDMESVKDKLSSLGYPPKEGYNQGKRI